MAWVVGIDEAGYGPNLGPLVMTSVACRVPDDRAAADLWHVLRAAVRKCCDKEGGPVLVDDSKLVHATTPGVLGLERGVLATAAACLLDQPLSLTRYLEAVSPDGLEDLRREPWFTGTTGLPAEAAGAEVAGQARCFAEACAAAGITLGRPRSVVVCPARFNALCEQWGTKGAVLAHGLTELLRFNRACHNGEAAHVHIDKHGGRNTYAAMLQHALPGGIVMAHQEGADRSHYVLHHEGPAFTVTFRPRADTEHFAVALASMASKYLRELLMLEFNRFWQRHVPGLRPTAGYPGDAARFYAGIRPAMDQLGLAADAVWRKR
jgi:ribonuclease HII